MGDIDRHNKQPLRASHVRWKIALAAPLPAAFFFPMTDHKVHLLG